MAKTKRELYDSERAHLKHLSGIEIDSDREERGEPTDAITEDEAETILEFLDAKDSEVVTVADHTGDSTKADGTLARYANTLKRTARIAEFDLLTADADQLNHLMDDIRQGRASTVKDEGLATGTVKNFQTALRRFYEWLDNGVAKEEIVISYPDRDSSVDERDILTKEEIQAIREVTTHPRDRAFIDMLLYTGQRLSALLNLRIQDINPDDGPSGTFYLNTEAGDLKGASGKRPLLYAQKAVRDWLNKHPCQDDPDAYFFTTKYEWDGRDIEAGSRMDDSSIYKLLQRIGRDAGVPDRKMNAHNFRHTFVTICKREYDMDNDTIKRLIGHEEGSNIMETTYSHLTDEDVIAAAERATDLRDDEPESSLTPEVCDVCGERIEKQDAKACPSCGTVFTPDARSVQQGLEGGVQDLKEEAEDVEEYSRLDKLERMVRENPELLDLLEDLADE